MNHETAWKAMLELSADPFFKRNFFDLLLMAQKEGMEAAKRYWHLSSSESRGGLPSSWEMYETLISFYTTFGFVPRSTYDQALKENQELRQENQFLKDTIRELQFNIFEKYGAGFQETWREITDRQLAMHRDMGKAFFDLFK